MRRLIFRADHEEHWPAGLQNVKNRKTLIDFAVLEADGNTTRMIAHVLNPRTVRPVTCTVHWYECCIQKFFDLYFVGRIHPRLDHPHIHSHLHPKLIYTLTQISEVTKVTRTYTLASVLPTLIYLSIRIYSNIFTSYRHGYIISYFKFSPYLERK